MQCVVFKSLLPVIGSMYVKLTYSKLSKLACQKFSEKETPGPLLQSPQGRPVGKERIGGGIF